VPVKKVIALIVTILAVSSSPALCATVSGKVRDRSGKPVPGIILTVRDVSGKVIQSVLSGRQGEYSFASVRDGSYRVALDPGLYPYKKGGPVEVLVNGREIKLNWTVSASDSAVAIAEKGGLATLLAGSPFGLTTAEFVAVSVAAAGAAGGIGVGAFAADGGFGGGGSVASPSK
jgi:hypothetical protein